MTRQSDIAKLERLIEIQEYLSASGVKIKAYVGHPCSKETEREVLEYFGGAMSFFSTKGPASRLLEVLKERSDG